MVSYSFKSFQKSIGFHNVETILAHMKEVTQPTLQITNTGHDPVCNHGKIATLPKVNCNTSLLPCTSSFKATFHFDIVYGASTAIEGYRYCFWLVDRANGLILEYPLKSLNEEEILHAMKVFICNVGGPLPSKMIADCDFKLIGGTVHEFLAGVHFKSPDGDVIVTGTPDGCQNQNGLAEIKWQHAMDMVCIWITSNDLPKQVW
eukprot:15324685-Ditylum_brightwellii.AAC.1